VRFRTSTANPCRASQRSPGIRSPRSAAPHRGPKPVRTSGLPRPAVTAFADTVPTRQPATWGKAHIAAIGGIRPHDGKSRERDSKPARRQLDAIDRPVESMIDGHASAAFVWACSGPGQRPSTRSKQFHARVVASSLRKEVRKAREWNTARARQRQARNTRRGETEMPDISMACQNTGVVTGVPPNPRARPIIDRNRLTRGFHLRFFWSGKSGKFWPAEN
jgi:hypothetical protein